MSAGTFSRGKSIRKVGLKNHPLHLQLGAKFQQSYVSIYSPSVPSYHITGIYLFKILLFKIKLN